MDTVIKINGIPYRPRPPSKVGSSYKIHTVRWNGKWQTSLCWGLHAVSALSLTYPDILSHSEHKSCYRNNFYQSGRMSKKNWVVLVILLFRNTVQISDHCLIQALFCRGLYEWTSTLFYLAIEPRAKYVATIIRVTNNLVISCSE